MMAVFMDAARSAGVADRVISYHSSLGVLEWPSVVFEGAYYPGVSELAALQSAAFGVPADRHIEVTHTMPGPDGTLMPRSLLTEIAAYGRFPRMGSPYCRMYAKKGVVSAAWTPMVNRLKGELGRPVRILKVTSNCARSSWAPAGAPTAPPAHTNMPASGVRCSASTRSSGDVWKRSSATSVTASRRHASMAGLARSKGSRSASKPPANKLASLDRLTRTRNRTPVALGMPIIPRESR
ncbi:hypothetical protein [Streptomyces chartreusis]